MRQEEGGRHSASRGGREAQCVKRREGGTVRQEKVGEHCASREGRGA